jgi:NAD(P)-dependent dehydrogenase (short-subunit alcohol dehydrogenase family)
VKAEVLAGLFGLQGKVAMVTDSGGLASVDVAPLLADCGATVVVADSDRAAGAKLAASIGGEAQALEADIESEPAVRQLFEQLRARHGRLDILVNCAGLNANQPYAEATLEQFDAMVSLNYRSVFMLMRGAVPLMKQGGGGRIVNISTMGALHPVLHGNQGYCSSRAAVTMLTRAVAMDHARDRILANVVMPGAIAGKTRFHPGTQQALQAGRGFGGPGAEAERRLPLGYGSGRDIAAAVLYLAGPAGAYITGQSLVLDGGFLTH